MTVVVTGLRGIPNIMGGIESHCEELLPRLCDLDPSQDIVVAGRKPYLDEAEQTYCGVKVLALPSPKNASLEAICSTLVGVLYAWRKRASLIHIHAIGPALLAPLARLLGLKVILTHHGADYDRAKWGPFAKFMLRLGERVGVSAAHRVILVSPSLERRIAQRWPKSASKLIYIPNGAPRLPTDGLARSEVLQSLGLREGEFVLTVGRIVPEKGLDYLISSFLESGRPGVLAVAGAADHESEFSRSVLAQACERVVFLGPQTRSTLRHLYQGASLFVLPSFHEGLPIAALEAASCGTPCLLSDISGNLDIGLPKSCYFPVGDKEALTDAFQKPVESFAVNASEVRTAFDWELIARRSLEIYRSLQRDERVR